MTREQALKLRKLIEQISGNISEDDSLDAKLLFPHYKIGVSYAVGDRFTYNDKLYKVVQAHTSQADWEPDKTPALYVEIAPPDTIPVWKQPLGPQDAYNTGDKVHYPAKGDPVYESLIDNNVWSPEAYPAGWKTE